MSFGSIVQRGQNARPFNLVDSDYELIDPTPDIRSLFQQFDQQFFYGSLAAIEVKWSTRMTLCAGLCCYEGHGGLCSIKLSQPLLTLRPRKDLVETLLHEMIHAYLFVTANDRDREGHGPEFQSHMHRINAAAGTNITIYHSFHAEVRNYQQHWWRCDGPCRQKAPYFGYVRRAMNRAPGPSDNWHEGHKRQCGGTFVKIKEPENYQQNKKGQKKEKDSSVPNIAKGQSNPSVQGTTSSQRSITSFVTPHNAKTTGDVARSSNLVNTTVDNLGSGHVLGFSDTRSGQNEGQKGHDRDMIASRNKFLDKISRTAQNTAHTSSNFQKKPNVSSHSGAFSSSNSAVPTPVIDLDSDVDTDFPVCSSNEAHSSHDVLCPSCNFPLPLAELNRHLDLCLESIEC